MPPPAARSRALIARASRARSRAKRVGMLGRRVMQRREPGRPATAQARRAVGAHPPVAIAERPGQRRDGASRRRTRRAPSRPGRGRWRTRRPGPAPAAARPSGRRAGRARGPPWCARARPPTRTRSASGRAAREVAGEAERLGDLGTHASVAGSSRASSSAVAAYGRPSCSRMREAGRTSSRRPRRRAAAASSSPITRRPRAAISRSSRSGSVRIRPSSRAMEAAPPIAPRREAPTARRATSG